MSSKTILIVDDSITIQRMLKHTLQQVGYTVLTASSGALALNQIARTPVDLTIIDLSMPDMDGLELLQRLRNDETRGQLPVIMLTASGTNTDKSAAKNLGANAYLNKPVSSSELLETVAHTLVPAPVASTAPASSVSTTSFTTTITLMEQRSS